MDFIVAKDLMEAGFAKPAHPNGQMLMSPAHAPFDHSKDVYEPTLDELIEACGRQFHSLYYRGDAEMGRWSACTRGEHPAHSYLGQTPTEAVARLWLALKAQ